MKKLIIKTLIGLGIFVVVIILVFTGFSMKAMYEIKTMHPAATGHIIDNIYAIQDNFSNVYLVKDNSQYIAIDAGNDINNISSELEQLKINPESIKAVILTHTDGDHIAGLSLFKNADIYFSTQEEKMVNGEKARMLFIKTTVDIGNYSLIDDKQVLAIGSTKIQGILTPGHTAGSMCYLINDKYLFTGDALGLKDGKIQPFNKFFNMDSKTALQSIINITNLSTCEYILTAHHGYTNDYQNAVKDWGK